MAVVVDEVLRCYLLEVEGQRAAGGEVSRKRLQARAEGRESAANNLYAGGRKRERRETEK